MKQESKTPTLHDMAAALMPGGVSSPVRALGAVGGGPMTITHGQGATITDADGSQYIDLQMAFGPLPVGHAHPDVVAAVQQAAARGLHFGALHPDEVRLAQRVVDLHPAVERLRFVNSGTEAVMSAVRLARAATGRDLIVKFGGGYHGHSDAFLSEAGSGMATFGIRSSPGVPEAMAGDTATLMLDDEQILGSFFEEHGHRVAAAIVEGVPANSGLLPQRKEWHRQLRQVTSDHDSLLIVDEVITGFRLGWGGATELLGLEPDLVTLGKILGGGMPVGAYGGRSELMAQVAPEGAVYQAGTLSGSPLAMAAGLATLDAMAQFPDVHAILEQNTAGLARRLGDLASDAGIPLSTPHVGSLLWLLPETDAAYRQAPNLSDETTKRYGDLHRAMRRHGVYLPPSAYELAFLSTTHDEAVLDQIADAFAKASKELSG